MAGLPRQFPNLAIHLTDQARTPILSSAAAATATATDQQTDPSSSSPSSPSPVFDDCISPTSHAAGPPVPSKPTRQQRAQALDDLAATALRARDAAARLGLGADLPSVPDASPDASNDAHDSSSDSSIAALIAALGMTPPEHLVVTYNTGAVVMETFLDDRSHSSSSHANNGLDNENDQDHDSHAPSLVGIVAAPDAQSLRDAQRATARLERIGRQVQQELVAQNNR